MECLRLTVYSFILFGYTIFQSEAGLFDPALNIFDTQQRDSASNNVFNAFLSPFRGNVNNQRPDLSQLKDREPVNERPWWKSVSTQSPIIQHIFKDQTTIKTTTSDYDAIVAKRFPEGVKLLENLKELNKLKEERERKAGYEEKEVHERNNGYGEREARERKDGYGERDARDWKGNYGEREARERKDGYGEREARDRQNGNRATEARERNDGYGEKGTSERKDGYGVKDNVVPKPTNIDNDTKSNDDNTVMILQ